MWHQSPWGKCAWCHERRQNEKNYYWEAKDRKEAAKAISKTRKATDSESPKKKIWTASEISKMKPHEFEKFEAEIDLARLEGRIEQR